MVQEHSVCGSWRRIGDSAEQPIPGDSNHDGKLTRISGSHVSTTRPIPRNTVEEVARNATRPTPIGQAVNRTKLVTELLEE